MKKLLITAFALVASCMAFVACGEGGKSSGAVPTDFSLNTKGELSWDGVEGATSYVVSVGSQVKEVSRTKQDLFELITTPGSYTVSVSAVGGKAATYSLTAVQLDTPSTPVIVEDPDTHAVRFVWEGGANTRSYLQEVNGSGRWVSNTENYYEISSAGTYSIAVKAKAYAAKQVLYLESEASATSETYEYVQGPIVELWDVGVINWSVEDGVEYDSFNLWANGEKIKENVLTSDEGYDLTGGSDPAITKTGEYNIQIEAVKDGQSYWSNMLMEVGTYNVNENEIYSFDNRQLRTPPLSIEGFGVSNEQYHGDSGYSLRYDATKSGQINLVRYADGTDNFIDYKTIRTISYWVYVEPISGVEGNFPASDLPAPKWEKAWNNGATYKQVFFRATEGVPYGQWTKVTFENVQNAYSDVLILSFIKELGQDYVIYIDDITYDAIWDEATKDDAQYEAKFTAYASQSGSWQSYETVAVDLGSENANKTVTLTMQVCGNAPANIPNGSLGLFYDVVQNADPADADFVWIDTDKISMLDTWSTVTMTVKTDATGKVYLSAAYKQDNGKILPFSIFMKDVQVTTEPDNGGTEPGDGGTDPAVDGTAMPTGTQNTKDSRYYQSFVALSTDLAVGTTVTVTMEIYITGTNDEWGGEIYWVDTVYTTAGGEVNAKIKVLDARTDEKGTWLTVEFDATVRKFDVLRDNPNFNTMDVSSDSNAVYLFAANFTSANSFNYKNVQIVEKAAN